jgi:hypothetical protein
VAVVAMGGGIVLVAVLFVQIFDLVRACVCI